MDTRNGAPRTDQQYSNDLRTLGDSAGQTFEQRYNQFVKAFRALVGHPALASHTAKLLADAFAVLLSEIQMLAWFPSDEIKNEEPHHALRKRLELTFFKFLRHPETDPRLARLFVSIGKAVRLVGKTSKRDPDACPCCGQHWDDDEGEEGGEI